MIGNKDVYKMFCTGKVTIKFMKLDRNKKSDR